jgi:hypothetical protein
MLKDAENLKALSEGRIANFAETRQSKGQAKLEPVFPGDFLIAHLLWNIAGSYANRYGIPFERDLSPHDL